jgi:cytoskeletal protein RodZ
MVRRVEDQLMSLVRIAGLLILFLTTGCVGMDRPSQGEPPTTGATQEKAPAPQQAAAPQEKSVATTPAQTAPKRDVPVAVEPVVPPAALPTTASKGSAAKPEAPAAKPPAKAPASPAPTKESSVPPVPKPPPLDLAALEKRLKETNAIGVFTKLTLKNQVDTLLDQFREYYQGRVKTTLAQLRQPYDQLLLKVLSLLQDSDPPLARAIVESREAIWGILSDPDKFRNL